VLRIEPESAKAHYNLGVILAKSGRLAEALTHFDEALWINPDPDPRRVLDGLKVAQR
jgi:tetratricopeptide (TPR) repeat protein